MHSIEISNKTHLIRHWFKWYRVQRGGTDWQPLKIEKRPAPFSFKKTTEKLSKLYPTTPAAVSLPLPDVLDERAADLEAIKNTPKKNKHK